MGQIAGIKILFGAGNVGDSSRDPTVRYGSAAEANDILDIFYNRGYRDIDTARAYPPMAHNSSETTLGAAEAGKRFRIDTKIFSHGAGAHSRENIAKNIDASLAALKIPQINIQYLHQPERSVPFEEIAEAMDKAYREGKFKQFGLSNYRPGEVEQFMEICEQRGFVKPSVYQGHYNAVVRGGEKELLPVLRKHNMVFYAWSPAAGGFLAGNHKNIQPGARFDTSHRLGNTFTRFYGRDSVDKAASIARDAASKHGISGHAAALRWTAYHGALDGKLGDGVVIGASNAQQLNQNLDALEAGPLPKEVADAISAVYAEIPAGETPPCHT